MNILRFYASCLLLTSTTFVHADLLYQDDFEDQDLTSATQSMELTWQVIQGGVAIQNVSDDYKLAFERGSSLAVTNETVNAGSSYTVTFEATIVWSNNAGFVFAYGDAQNYYWFGLGGTPGIYRVLNGIEERIYDDEQGKLRQPHAREAIGHYKVYVENDGSKITIAIDKDGDGVDYDVEIEDDSSEAVSRFQDVAIGGMVESGDPGTAWFMLDDIEVHDVQLLSDRQPVIYYVSDTTGDDSRSNLEAQNQTTPWKTIQRASLEAFSGDEIVVMSGIYRETIQPVYSGKSLDLPITYRAFNKTDVPVIDGAEQFDASSWVAVAITDYQGNTQQVYHTPIDWNPVAASNEARTLFVAQHPTPSNPEDPYDISEYMEVPAEYNSGDSTSELIDPVFFTQTQDDYWVGARLLLYDGYANAVNEATIIDYIPGESKIIVEPIGSRIGPDRDDPDSYAIRNHRGLIDSQGEFFIDVSVSPYQMYVMPYSTNGITAVEIYNRDHGFDFSVYGPENIVIDGFEIRRQIENGINVSGSPGSVVLNDIYSHHNMGNGVSARYCDGVTISNGVFAHNYNNGVNFSNGYNYAVLGSEITKNGNNGIWVGNGSSEYYSTFQVTLIDNYFHHQDGRRAHPDNYQMHQVYDILMDGNLYIQDGHQNMWCQYTDLYTIQNNIFINGPLGINSSIHNKVFNNIFMNSTLRYDQHLTNHPNYGDYYKPQEVAIQNNIIINSSISWPDAAVIDRFQVFTIDHNYYNIENAYFLASWQWNGYQLGVASPTTIAIAHPEITSSDYSLFTDVSLIWSHEGRIIILYSDEDNYYSIGLGENGVFRMHQGVETQIFDDVNSELRLPHAGGALAHFSIDVTRSVSEISFSITRDMDDEITQVTVADTETTAIDDFQGTVHVGVMTATDDERVWFFVDNYGYSEDGGLLYEDDFEDGNYDSAQGADGISWQVVSGTGLVIQQKGGRGVGLGEGSILATDGTSFDHLFVQSPDQDFTSFDFHHAENSPLIDAGTDIGILVDIEGLIRPAGDGIDIGPYEYGAVADPDDPRSGDSDDDTSGDNDDSLDTITGSCGCQAQTAFPLTFFLALLWSVPFLRKKYHKHCE